MAAAGRELRFGRYRLVERVGAGGMALVYKAIADGPMGFQRKFIIKRILPTYCRDPQFVAMFLTEARLSAQLHHPNIVQVYELGELDGEYFIAMELVEGHDLATLLKAGRTRRFSMPVPAAAFITAQLLRALGYAHALSGDSGPLDIVHRDVSPSNIMLTDTGGVKLLDFGIAKAANHFRAASERSATGSLKGKFAYLSPEQAEGRPADRRSDIFAVGIVLLEMLTFQRVFRGANDWDTLRLVREAQPPRPSSLREDISPELEAFIMKLLARDANERFQTCDEALERLRPLLHELHSDEGAVELYLRTLGPVQRSALPVDAADVPLSPPEAASQEVPTRILVAPPVTPSVSGEVVPEWALSNETPRPRRRWFVGAIGTTAVSGFMILTFARGPSKTEAAAPPPHLAPASQVVPPSAAAPPLPPPRIELPASAPIAAEPAPAGPSESSIVATPLPRPKRAVAAAPKRAKHVVRVSTRVRTPDVAAAPAAKPRSSADGLIKDPFAQ